MHCSLRNSRNASSLESAPRLNLMSSGSSCETTRSTVSPQTTLHSEISSIPCQNTYGPHGATDGLLPPSGTHRPERGAMALWTPSNAVR